MEDKKPHRTTMSVPADLHAKMQKLKPFVNFSKLFQETIRVKIEELEQREQMITDMEQSGEMQGIIDRLKQEKQRRFSYPVQKGIEDATRWVSMAHYIDLKASVEWDGSLKIPHNIPLRGFIYEQMDKDKYLSWIKTPKKCSDSAKYPETTVYNVKYLKSFKLTVDNFWNSIKDEVEPPTDTEKITRLKIK